MSNLSTPSIAQIQAATEVLSPPDASAKVVRLGHNFAVKFGLGVSLVEGQSQRFIAENTGVPVPKVFDVFSEHLTKINYIVMEYVSGRTLEFLWDSLTPAEKFDITNQLQAALKELRSLQSPPFLGSIGQQPFADGIFWEPVEDPLISGPFQNEAELNEGILRRLERTEPPSHLSLLRLLMTTTLRDHHIVFTHGDLQPKNIMVDRMGTKENGNSIFKIKIIDWEISGWYPEYWEFCNATISGRFRPHWLEVIQQILQVYPTEYLMMQNIRSLLFY